MFRVRGIGSIWRARVPSTWAQLSRTLISSEATISSKTTENGQSIHIERKMKHHIKTGKIADALQLFEESRNGGKSWAVDSCFSSLLHMFVQHDQHEAVDKLYEDMKRNASYIGEGAKTTMIKSYCNRGQFKQAIEMLGSINDENVAHHTRHYDWVITSLGRNGLTKQALQLFEEKLQRLDTSNCLVCKISKTDRRLYVDKEMIASLLNPDNVKANTGNEQSEGDNNRLSPKRSMGKYELSGDAALKSNQNDVDGYHYDRMSQKVFHYLEHAGERLPANLLNVIHSRFNHDPVYNWTWKFCSVSEIGTCSNCRNQLTSGILPSDIHQLECEIISPKHNFSEIHGKDLGKNIHKELEDYHFKKFVKERGPFDVIIDGMNVGSYGSTSRFKFTQDLVEETVHHFASQQKKVLLIIRNEMITEDLHTKLENVCAVFINNFKNDDLYFLYAAAFSGMQQVEVITNDKLRDHRLLLPTKLWWTFLRWTRLNCVRFKVNDKGKLRFFRQKFDPVVQLSGNSWHFPVEDHTWRCVTRSGGRTNLTRK